MHVFQNPGIGDQESRLVSCFLCKVAAEIEGRRARIKVTGCGQVDTERAPDRAKSKDMLNKVWDNFLREIQEMEGEDGISLGNILIKIGDRNHNKLWQHFWRELCRYISKIEIEEKDEVYADLLELLRELQGKLREKRSRGDGIDMVSIVLDCGIGREITMDIPLIELSYNTSVFDRKRHIKTVLDLLLGHYLDQPRIYRETDEREITAHPPIYTLKPFAPEIVGPTIGITLESIESCDPRYMNIVTPFYSCTSFQYLEQDAKDKYRSLLKIIGEIYGFIPCINLEKGDIDRCHE